MSFLDSSAFWGIAGIAVGFLVSAFFFFRGKSKKILKYKVDSISLITESMADIPEIRITLAGQPVQSITSSTIEFTNIGNQNISSDDFANLAPLRISVKNKFFSTSNGYQIISDSPSTALALHGDSQNIISIEFDFLRPKQSFSITLLHEGNLSVDGELKTGKMVNAASIKPLMDRTELSIYGIFAAIGAIFFSTIFFCMFLESEKYSIIEAFSYSITLSLIIIFLISIVILVITFILYLFSNLKDKLKSKFKF